MSWFIFRYPSLYYPDDLNFIATDAVREWGVYLLEQRAAGDWLLPMGSRPARRRKAASKRRWVRRVQSTSNAMDLEPGVFKKDSAKAIASSVLQSVRKSRRKRGTTLSSGISMMTYYSNRAGSSFTQPQAHYPGCERGISQARRRPRTGKVKATPHGAGLTEIRCSAIC